MSALYAALLIFSFQFSLLFFHILVTRPHQHCGVLLVLKKALGIRVASYDNRLLMLLVTLVENETGHRFSPTYSSFFNSLKMFLLARSRLRAYVFADITFFNVAPFIRQRVDGSESGLLR